MKKNSRAIEWSLFALYCAAMVWLLFLQRPSRMTYMSYWETIRANLNLVPFRTVLLFLRSYSFMPRSVIINLAGNVAVFVPLGLFLPCLFRKQRNFGIFVLTVTGLVIIIEVTQLFTCLGSCDVDDLILNLVGASVGFGIYSVPPVKKLLIRCGLIK